MDVHCIGRSLRKIGVRGTDLAYSHSYLSFVQEHLHNVKDVSSPGRDRRCIIVMLSHSESDRILRSDDHDDRLPLLELAEF